MTIELDADLDQTLADLVKSGRFPSPQDARREALLLLDGREFEQHVRLERLRGELQIGLDQLDRGERHDAEAVFDELMAGLPDSDSND